MYALRFINIIGDNLGIYWISYLLLVKYFPIFKERSLTPPRQNIFCISALLIRNKSFLCNLNWIIIRCRVSALVYPRSWTPPPETWCCNSPTVWCRPCAKRCATAIPKCGWLRRAPSTPCTRMLVARRWMISCQLCWNSCLILSYMITLWMVWDR